MDETVTLTEYERMVIRCLLADRKVTLAAEIDALKADGVSKGLLESYDRAMIMLDGLLAKFPFKILSASLLPLSR